ncbi:hypothetical protein [Helicobacter sp.]|uniref:ArnT family glycosyltransferase n=1 Tax=Helicobacter sp. TaxID=218 RepID=UPI0037509C0B|nr:hypothetical protein [Helicobacter sp.]
MMESSQGRAGPNIYPWGLPLLLAPLYKTFGFNLIAFKFVGIVTYGIFIGFFYLLCIKFLTRTYALGATLLFVFNPTLLDFASNHILSDTPFLCCTLIAIFCFIQLFSHTKHALLFGLIGGWMMLMGFLLRTNGIVLLLALFVTHLCLLYKYFFPKSRFTQNFLANLQIHTPVFSHIIPYVIFCIGVVLATMFLSIGGEGHGAVLLHNISLKSIIQNTLYYCTIFGDFFAIPNLMPESLKSFGAFLANMLRFGLFLCFLYPIIHGVRIFWRQSSAIFLCIFIIGSLCLLILWPALQGLRFVFGILPLIVFFGALGLENLSLYKKSFITKALQILSIVILGFFAFKSTFYIARTFLNHHSADSKNWEAYSSDARALYEYIKTHTNPNEIIVFFKPRMLYLNTNRLSVTIREPQTLQDRLQKGEFIVNDRSYTIAYILHYTNEYILEHGLPRQFLDSKLASGELSIVYENPQFVLYKIFNIRSPDFEEIAKLLKSPIIFDGRNIYHTLHLESKGFEYHQIGVRNASIQP